MVKIKKEVEEIVPPYQWADFPDDEMWFDKTVLGVGKRNIVLEGLLGGRIEPRSIDFEELERHKDHVIVKITHR